jgi:hypothetical protein
MDRAQAEKGGLFVRRQRLEGGGGTRAFDEKAESIVDSHDGTNQI